MSGTRMPSPAPSAPDTSQVGAERIGDLLTGPGRAFSFEFFPPKDAEGEEVLWRSIGELEPLAPTFVSVTYGAGGTTRDRTLAITGRIARETSLLPMAHLTCVGHTVPELQQILAALRDEGVVNVLALRGDPPGGPGTAWEPTPGGVDYASELAALIHEHQPDLCIGVAAFPEGHRDSASLDDDIAILRAKQDAGAEFAVTEMVLRAGDYVGLVERAADAGVTIPVLPGIMPILRLSQMERMVELSGRDIPADVRARLEPLADDPAAVRAEGIELATELCEDLLSSGAPGLHFYTLNRSKATREIWSALALPVG